MHSKEANRRIVNATGGAVAVLRLAIKKFDKSTGVGIVSPCTKHVVAAIPFGLNVASCIYFSADCNGENGKQD